jgi:Ca2+-binding RTX toxin-like protein
MWFIDSAQLLHAGAGCVAGVPVWCQGKYEQINLGGGDDRYSGSSNLGFVTVDGGTGNDHIRANHLGNDVYGGSGSDWIAVGANEIGSAYGENGDDDIRGLSAAEGVRLSGGRGDDLLYGDEHRNELSGDEGDDAVIGAGVSSFSREMSLSGGSGDDVLLDAFAGQHAAAATLSGGDGNDIVVGGPGVDNASGGDGNDVIDVSSPTSTEDGGADTVVCGLGNDTVYADGDDVVADDCETRLDGPMPPSVRVDAALGRLTGAFDVTITR